MPIKVMVVDDSAFMRQSIKKILEMSGKVKVIETARNGQDAIKKLENNVEIEVITMDVEMPVMDGLEATKIIMKENPIPIVMLSSVTQARSEATIRALEYGAVDFILKPSGNISLDIDKIEKEINNKILAASRSRMAKRTIKRDKDKEKEKEEKSLDRVKARSERTAGLKESKPISNYQSIVKAKDVKPEVIIIGTSTGGPQSLQKVIPNLPKLGVPIIIIQHMPAGFTASLANSLNKKSELTVKEATYGEELEKDVVYVAPGGPRHMYIEKRINKMILKERSNEEEKRFYTPSVDVMVNSAAQVYKEKALCVILTGMGNDGLEGFRNIKNYGAYTIAESEESAVVYGMPKVVVNAGLADEVVPIRKVAESISKRFKKF